MTHCWTACWMAGSCSLNRPTCGASTWTEDGWPFRSDVRQSRATPTCRGSGSGGRNAGLRGRGPRATRRRAARRRISSPGITFRQALERRGERILGGEYFKGYGPDFPLLIKILDPGEAIVFHFHAQDADILRYRERFPGQRWGKDEADYFLSAPQGPVPYTHVGLYPGGTRRVLGAAGERGGGA